jgi:hypothetical protein
MSIIISMGIITLIGLIMTMIFTIHALVIATLFIRFWVFNSQMFNLQLFYAIS